MLMPATALGQIMETFESVGIPNWIQTPEGRWNTDNTSTISGSLSLHHTFDNPGTGNDLIGLSLRNLHPDEGTVSWSFMIRHGTDPSSTNSWAVYLMSDKDPPSLTGNREANGFLVGINQTGSDDTLKLWKVKEGIMTTVISGRINWQTDIGTTEAVKIDVSRSVTGNYLLQVSRLNGVVIDSSPGNDPDLFSPAWFVLSYKYTSTRDRLLWFDDVIVNGVFHEDISPPEIVNCEVTGNNSLSVTFSEELSRESLLQENFTVGGELNNVTDVTKLNPVTIQVSFEKEFNGQGSHTLSIARLCDDENNCSNNVSCSFSFFRIRTGDVIISEIMADPDPQVSLPEREYIEIHNRTGSAISLKNWSLVTEIQDYPLPDQSINGGEYLILCPARDTSLFNHFGRSAGLKSFPALTDGGRVIAISDSSGSLIHGVGYSSKWYGDQLKSEGGWSLEIIDEKYPFSGEDNWTASVSREGGTPGRANSASGSNPDSFFYGITNIFPSDTINLKLSFSETVLFPVADMPEIKVDNQEIAEPEPSDPLLRNYHIELEEPLQNGKIYTLTASDEIRDFAGNTMQRASFSFGVPEVAVRGDILFNELLFNPLAGDPDFIEFYNNSGKTIDLSRLFLVTVNDMTGDTSESCYLSTENRCFLPGEYYVMTTDRKLTISHYPSADPEKIFEVQDLPSMPDDRGHLALFNRELDLIDEVRYDKDMHYSLLSDYDGISLEKVKQNGLSGDRSLWHSASESSGWGTPGSQNSAQVEEPVSNDEVKLSSPRISPDNDGNDDVLIVGLKLSGTGNVVSVTLFDETGGFVNKLTDNLLAGAEASIVWDGTADDGKLVRSGIYILLITVFDETGKSHNWKKVCTVIRK